MTVVGFIQFISVVQQFDSSGFKQQIFFLEFLQRQMVM